MCATTTFVFYVPEYGSVCAGVNGLSGYHKLSLQASRYEGVHDLALGCLDDGDYLTAQLLQNMIGRVEAQTVCLVTKLPYRKPILQQALNNYLIEDRFCSRFLRCILRYCKPTVLRQSEHVFPHMFDPNARTKTNRNNCSQ